MRNSTKSHLEDEKSIVVKIDARLLQHLGDLFGGRPAAVDLVVRRVVLAARSRHDERRVRDFAITFPVLFVAIVDDLLEEDLHGARPEMSSKT